MKDAYLSNNFKPVGSHIITGGTDVMLEHGSSPNEAARAMSSFLRYAGTSKHDYLNTISADQKALDEFTKKINDEHDKVGARQLTNAEVLDAISFILNL